MQRCTQGLRGAGDHQDGSKGAAGPQIPQTAARQRDLCCSDGLPEASEETPAASRVGTAQSLCYGGERGRLERDLPNGVWRLLGKGSPG